MERTSSKKTTVKSGVPQGTVLGLLCLLRYINDIGTDMSSNLKRFADDKLMYGFAHNVNDTLSLQLDLDRLVPWGGGYFPKIWVGVCRALLEPFPYFRPKFYDFPYPISDLTQNLIPYFRPDLTLFSLRKHLRRASNSQH